MCRSKNVNLTCPAQYSTGTGRSSKPSYDPFNGKLLKAMHVQKQKHCVCAKTKTSFILNGAVATEFKAELVTTMQSIIQCWWIERHRFLQDESSQCSDFWYQVSESLYTISRYVYNFWSECCHITSHHWQNEVFYKCTAYPWSTALVWRWLASYSGSPPHVHNYWSPLLL